MTDDRSWKKAAVPRRKLSDKELRAKLERLESFKGKLTKEQVALLDELLPYIVDLHRAGVRAVFRGLPEHEVDDLAQTTFVKAHELICNRGLGGGVKHRLFNVARTLRSNHYRARRRNPVELGLPSSSQERPRSVGSDERAVLMLSAYQRMRAQLPEPHREVLELVFEQERSTRDAAEILGISETAVQKRLFHVRAAMFAALGEFQAKDDEGDA